MDRSEVRRRRESLNSSQLILIECRSAVPVPGAIEVSTSQINDGLVIWVSYFLKYYARPYSAVCEGVRTRHKSRHMSPD